MFKMLIAIGVLFVLALGYILAVRMVTLGDRSIPLDRLSSPPTGAGNPDTLSVMIWNVGYAGLGAESDFTADGGETLQPPSKAVVKKNLAGIQEVLSEQDADVFMFQELARPGFLTRGVDVLSGVREALSGYSSSFSPDVKTRLLPGPLALKHGIGMFWRLESDGPEVIRLIEEPEPIAGFIPRRYHVQVLEFDHADVPWTLIDVHLSAFDEAANTRVKQLREVIALAEQHYARGRYVVLGGDWNMRLTQTDFPSTSKTEAQFWIHDLPKNELPDEWQLAFDPETPTVRTNERPYRRDENYRTIIDGLLVSPNVEVVRARGLDLDFQVSDHQPVHYTLAPRR